LDHPNPFFKEIYIMIQKNKNILFSLALCLSISAFSGCANTSSNLDQAQETSQQIISFEDDLGNTLEIAQPQRVACTIGSFADIWVLAGGYETLVAAPADTWTSFDLDLSEDVVNLGEIKNLNTEELAATSPDLVIASAKSESNKELQELLDSMNIPVAYFDVSSFSDYLRMLEICTKLTGNDEAYEQYGTSISSQVDEAIAMADGSNPSVLYMRATGKGVKAMEKEGSVLGEMLTDLDCHNITEDYPSLLSDLSMEAILQADPEYIFLIYQGSDVTDAQANMDAFISENPAWQSLSAVQNDKVIVLEHTLYNLKPNDKWGQAYLQLAGILYESNSN
jgi:iron complex transport system substrate-binding protein